MSRSRPGGRSGRAFASSAGSRAGRFAASSRAGRGRSRLRNQAGVTLLELMIAAVLGAFLLSAAGMVYVITDRCFRWGAVKVNAQQEVTVLTKAMTLSARGGASLRVYRLPDRNTKVETGDGLAVLDELGHLVARYEWSESKGTLVDDRGNRATALDLEFAEFISDPSQPRTVRFRFAAKDGEGNLVDLESAVSIRN